MPKIVEIDLEWAFEQNDDYESDDGSDNDDEDSPKFVKSELEEIVRKCKNKFEVKLHEDDDGIIFNKGFVIIRRC